jgi:hypothetical protein
MNNLNSLTDVTSFKLNKSVTLLDFNTLTKSLNIMLREKEKTADHKQCIERKEHWKVTEGIEQEFNKSIVCIIIPFMYSHIYHLNL